MYPCRHVELFYQRLCCHWLYMHNAKLCLNFEKSEVSVLLRRPNQQCGYVITGGNCLEYCYNISIAIPTRLCSRTSTHTYIHTHTHIYIHTHTTHTPHKHAQTHAHTYILTYNIYIYIYNLYTLHIPFCVYNIASNFVLISSD